MNQIFKTAASIIIAVLFAVPALPARDIAVKVSPLVSREFIERLNVQGNVNAIKSARVSPRIPGPIETIFVEEGDYVEANETKLFQIDSVKLQTNLDIRKQERSIAFYSMKEKEARLKQAQADYAKAKVDMDRFRLLWEDNSTSKDNYEKVQLKEKTSAANVEYLQAIVALALEQLKQTELAVKIAEKDLSDSLILSPITGQVAERMQEPGEMASPGKPIIVINDPTDNEVLAYIPASYYYRIITDKTRAIVAVDKEHSLEMTVTYKSPVINPTLRTFEIKARAKKNSSSIIPGQLAEISILLSSRNGFGVPNPSVVKRAESSVIFVIDGNKAKMIPVTTGFENDGMTEVFSKELKDGMQVICQGQHLLNDGQSITISGGN